MAVSRTKWKIDKATKGITLVSIYINKKYWEDKEMSNLDNRKFKMGYSVASNFDPNLITEIGKINKDKCIRNVYGKLRTDVLGGGRASMILPELSMADLENHINLCHENDLEFNYLLNPACSGNKELVKESHNEILRYIDSLVEIGIDWVTLANPYLCEVVRRRYPNLKIAIGLHANVIDIQHIKFWEKLGADELTLQHCDNRNFDTLEKMLIYTKQSGIELRLIANNACLHACPYRIAHSTGQSHASRPNEASQQFYFDYSLLKCIIEKVSNPTQLIAAEWIRPEDVKYYEELCEKTGNYNLTLKLVDRTKPTSFTLRAVKAYLAQRYDGNLLDIMLWPSHKEIANVNKSVQEAAATTESLFDVFKLPDVYVDNNKLNGFLEKFVSHYDCNKKVCDWTDAKTAPDSNSLECAYCKHWADKVITSNQEQVAQWLTKSRGIYNALCDSKLFAEG